MNDTDSTCDALPPEDPRARLLQAPMSRFQLIGVALVAIICAIDGFDILAITFAAPALAQQWHLDTVQLGLLLSSALFAMMGGSLLIAPAADVFGRRALVIVCLLLITAGCGWTALAPGFSQLFGSRVLTGVGVGAMMSVINPLAAEYASRRGRYHSLSLLNVGYPAGGLLGGLAAAWLLTHYGWRSIFVLATLIGLMILGAVWRWLPESPSFLLARRRPDTLERVNAYLARCGMPPLSALPAPDPAAAQEPRSLLLGAGVRGRTIRMVLTYTLYQVTLYYVFSWLPSLVAGMGFTPAQGTLVAAMLNLGGIAGGLCVGVAATRFGLKRTARLAVVLGAVMAAVLGNVGGAMGTLLVAAGIAGFCLFGGIIAILSAIWVTFPAQVRASGTGLTLGVGRIGAGIAPAMAGWLFAADVAPATVAMVMATAAAAAGVVLWTLPLPEVR